MKAIISKNAIKDRSYETRYTGRGLWKNAIYFDWNSGTYTDDDGKEKTFQGYKYMVIGTLMSKKEVLQAMYELINKGEFEDYARNFVWKVAETDRERFRVPLSV